MSLLAGINHAALMTADLQRLVEFYTGVFDAAVVFEETAPGFRHAILRVGAEAMLHPVELPGGAGAGRPRGHVDHLALNAASRAAFAEIRRRLVARGASDGVVNDLGPQLCLSFVDPDGMHAEVCCVVDAALAGFHAPTPVPAPAG